MACSAGMTVRKAVIPAAGFGTRMLPATKSQPKEMLPLVDVPAIQWVVEEAVACGITDVLVVTGRGKATLEDHFDRSVELERVLEAKGDEAMLARVRRIAEMAEVHYVRQAEALGLGHAVGCAAAHVSDEAFAVLLPDEIFPDADGPLPALLEAHERFGATVIAVRDMPRAEIRFYGAVDPEPVDDGLVRIRDFVEKPEPDEAPSTLGSIGRYVLTPDVLEAIAKTEPGAGGEIQLTDAIRSVARAGEAYAAVFSGRRFDIGNRLGHLTATVELACEHPELGEGMREFLAELVRRSGQG